MPSQYEIDTDVLDLCDDSHMMRFMHKDAKENLTNSSTSQFIEEGDLQNLSYGFMSPLGIITSDLFFTHLSIFLFVLKSNLKNIIIIFQMANTSQESSRFIY